MMKTLVLFSTNRYANWVFFVVGLVRIPHDRRVTERKRKAALAMNSESVLKFAELCLLFVITREIRMTERL